MAGRVADAHGQMLDAAFGAMRDKFGEAKSSMYADVMGFVHAIDFTERWIALLLAFHAILWAFIILTRERTQAQAFLFLALVLGTRAAEWLNGLGAAHWEAFAGQNYFDKHGVFMSVMWSAPLLGDAFLIILFALRSSVALLVQVKRAELRHTRKARARGKQE
ncbi:hypothetical protein KFE25_009410 [Diacronema lutheri]|uniref:Transmembrane protein 18 n=1 Tax=Diacronema lutheri TaxID=2081491 RepID=A0A8J5Y564_DIALT|nr:hypothetical protein KFE25_009410 [Diacronema lutheri]